MTTTRNRASASPAPLLDNTSLQSFSDVHSGVEHVVNPVAAVRERIEALVTKDKLEQLEATLEKI